MFGFKRRTQPSPRGVVARTPLGFRPLVGFDLETTSTDPFAARIVTACVAPEGGAARRWLVDPGIPIPTEAAAIHGVTTETARLRGSDARGSVSEIALELTSHWQGGAVVVIYNAAYDLRVLTEELKRHRLPALEVGAVIDPLVLWRNAERYRKGKKRLSDAVVRFGITSSSAHEAESDARAAVSVARALAPMTGFADWSPEQAAAIQAGWNKEWADSFATWLRKQGGDWRSVDSGWPLATKRRSP